jgi:hypothetical protein
MSIALDRGRLPPDLWPAFNEASGPLCRARRPGEIPVTQAIAGAALLFVAATVACAPVDSVAMAGSTVAPTSTRPGDRLFDPDFIPNVTPRFGAVGGPP